MFRIADIQRRSVVDPRVKVVMYTWGDGRRTAEGEHIPVMAQVGRTERGRWAGGQCTRNARAGTVVAVVVKKGQVERKGSGGDWPLSSSLPLA